MVFVFCQAHSSPTPEQNWRQLDNKVNELKTHYLVNSPGKQFFFFVCFGHTIVCRPVFWTHRPFFALQTVMQGIKKENKSLECLYEKLDSIQETWQFQGTGGVRWCINRGCIRCELTLHSYWSLFSVEQHAKLAQSLADVKAECQKKANFLTRTAQVLRTPLTTLIAVFLTQLNSVLAPNSSTHVAFMS